MARSTGSVLRGPVRGVVPKRFELGKRRGSSPKSQNSGHARVLTRSCTQPNTRCVAWRIVSSRSMLRSGVSTPCSPNSSLTRHQRWSSSTASGPTPQHRSSSLQETTRSDCAPNGPGHTCVVLHRPAAPSPRPTRIRGALPRKAGSYSWISLVDASPMAVEKKLRSKPISTPCSWGWRNIALVLML